MCKLQKQQQLAVQCRAASSASACSDNLHSAGKCCVTLHEFSFLCLYAGDMLLKYGLL